MSASREEKVREALALIRKKLGGRSVTRAEALAAYDAAGVALSALDGEGRERTHVEYGSNRAAYEAPSGRPVPAGEGAEEAHPHKPIHMTPTEAGREFGMHRREVIARCMEWGVPIFQGRLDRMLFAAEKAQHEAGSGSKGRNG